LRSGSSPQPTPKVSVVVCTYNRAGYLKYCLEMLDALEYRNFEVVVVDGPSLDGTSQLLDRCAHRIKIGKNPTRNLSISRNIGIKLAAGEIVAFIDDDGVPPTDWLDKLVLAYRDPQVGGAGGRVVSADRKQVQFSYGVLDIWGRVEGVRPSPSNLNQADGVRFNTLMGVNSSFRRNVLQQIGGFDETYNYYHDEADVVYRTIQAGYKIDHSVDAPVRHQQVVGGLRGGWLGANLEAIGQNTVYFALKATKGRFGLLSRIRGSLRACLLPVVWARSDTVMGPRSLTVLGLIALRLLSGASRGLRLGFLRPRRTLSPDELKPERPFKNFSMLAPTVARKTGLHIGLASQDYLPGSTAGIARRTASLAKELTRRGHDAYVITRGEGRRTRYHYGVPVVEVSNERLPELGFLSDRPEALRHLRHAYSVRQVVKELALARRMDLFYAPLWDVEGYAVGLDATVPFVVHIESQLKTVMKTNEWPETPDLTLMCQLEKRVLEMEGTRGIASSSRAALETVKELYDVDFGTKPTQTVYCAVDMPEEVPKKNHHAGTIRVLFVGRLEKRKGAHTLFDAAPAIIRKNRHVEFVIVGDDTLPSEEGIPLRAAYAKFLSRSGALKKMRFLGRVDEERLQQEYSECDIFVAPSLYESFGIIYAEAMAWGKPVIGCTAGGIPEVVEHNGCGILIKPGNVAELAEAVLRLADSPETRRQFGQRAREIAATKFSPATQADSALEIFHRVLDEQT